MTQVERSHTVFCIYFRQKFSVHISFDVFLRERHENILMLKINFELLNRQQVKGTTKEKKKEKEEEIKQVYVFRLQYEENVKEKENK